MKLSLVVLALFGCAVHGFFFGCDMKAAAGVATGGYGQVACYSAVIDTDSGAVNMACAFKYANLTSTPTLAHFHVGDIATASGPVTITFAGPTSYDWTLATVGTAYQSFSAGSGGFTPINSATFPATVQTCATGGCYFNLHTTNNGGGELRCQLNALAPIFSSTGLNLAPNPGAVNTTGTIFGVPASSQGKADAQMAQVGASGVYAWGYFVQYLTFSPVTNAHIHQATTAGSSGTGPVKVQLDQGAAATLGQFVGLALEGISATEQPTSNWPVHDAAFDAALAQGFCYINVHTTANPGGEIRVNLVASGASQATLALFAIVAMLASFLSL